MSDGPIKQIRQHFHMQEKKKLHGTMLNSAIRPTFIPLLFLLVDLSQIMPPDYIPNFIILIISFST
ncbi:MAG: hypothetical protein MJE68_03720, partial [Proteobacteria bacterium]|nr:hypothetical protein [Pseudomonadota bacterium]